MLGMLAYGPVVRDKMKKKIKWGNIRKKEGWGRKELSIDKSTKWSIP